MLQENQLEIKTHPRFAYFLGSRETTLSVNCTTRWSARELTKSDTNTVRQYSNAIFKTNFDIWMFTHEGIQQTKGNTINRYKKHIKFQLLEVTYEKYT